MDTRLVAPGPEQPRTTREMDTICSAGAVAPRPHVTPIKRVVEMNRSADSHVQLASGGRDDLRQLFALSFSEPARDDEDLRHAVLDYVRTAKAERLTPEMVIVTLKRAIIDAATARISYRAANELTDRVVRWFIDGYYGADGLADRGRELRISPSPRTS